MEVCDDRFELVFVVNGQKLLDGESYERRYRCLGNLALRPGHYIVYWPDHVRSRQFDERALFHGPFRHRWDAQAELALLIETAGPEISTLEHLSAA